MALDRLGRVGVLMGGPSSEREISLKSGKAVFEALKGSGVDAAAIDIKTDSRQENIRILKAEHLNCAFIALHGRFGEDGQIQQILETANIPYTGSGVEASRLAMDKIASLKILSEHGQNVPRSQFLGKSEYLANNDFKSGLNFPLVVKPANHGSSIGLTITGSQADMPKALALAFEYDHKAVIQEYVAGREFTVGVLNEEALPVIEIIPKNAYFDFQAKYQAGMTDYVVPARLSLKTQEILQHAGVSAHKALGCFGCSRTDIILSGKDIPFILEVNTIPGLTATSLLPKAAKAAGINFNELCLKLLSLAYEKAKV